MKRILLFLLLTVIGQSINAQNVGIGTNTPTAKLEVSGGDAKVNTLTVGLGNNSIATNTVVGYHALQANTTGSVNTTYGYRSLFNNTTGQENVAQGYSALFSNTGGNSNIAIGAAALFSNTTARNNVAVGVKALYNNTDRSLLVAVGDSALYNNGVGASQYYHSIANTAIGSKALYANTTGGYNTAIGSIALNNNTTGTANTATGSYALFSNTSGDNNTAHGYFALGYNSSGSNNTAHGAFALYNSSGSNNTAIGVNALLINQASNNTAVGYSALDDNTSGTANTALGYVALADNSTGNSNTSVGYGSINNNTTGSFNSAFGRSAYFDAVNLDNTTAIGYNAGGFVEASNRVEIGNTSVTVIAGQVGFSTYSDGRMKDNIIADVQGLSFINRLRPVTYNLNIHRQNEMVHDTKRDDTVWASKYDIEKIRMTGFIAQEVEQAVKDAGFNFSGVQAPKDANGLYSLRYSDFVMPLVKAVQELSQENEDLKKQNAEFKARLEKLEAAIIKK